MARISINISEGTLKQEHVVVGIDLGTTHSLIARVKDGQPSCVVDVDRQPIMPSLVHVAANGTPTVGDDALPYLTQDAANTVYSVKRLMGKAWADVATEAPNLPYTLVDQGADKLVGVQVGGRTFSPVELSALILGELKERAEHKLKTNVRQAVITVPAYFNDAQRQATKDAGKLAGLEVLRVVNEPTAAALAYGIGLDPADEKRVAIYDLGGGTFDLTILHLQDGVFEVLATHGDTHLGGDDLDQAVVTHWLEQLNLPANALDNDARQRLRLLAEATKKALSTAEQAEGTWADATGTQHTLSLTRQAFEAAIEPLVARTLAASKAALKDAELTPEQVDEVILVGGSTRVPRVKQAVGQLFGRTPHDSLDPDQVVALGAAVQADVLTGDRQDVLLLDVTPLSLGIETANGLMDVLLPRNSKVPNRVSRQYTTQVDGQVNLRIAVYQGERELVADNRKLASFELAGIPAMPAGLPKVEVTFVLDADGILTVSAKELRSGVAQSVDVRPSYGLTDAEVETMLMASLTHAEADVTTRLLREAQAEAKQRIYQTRRFMERHRQLFADDDHARIANLVDRLEALTETGGKELLHQAMDELEAETKPYAHQAMDLAVSHALKGKSV